MNNQTETSNTNNVQDKKKRSTMEDLDLVIINALLTGHNVVIPGFGYLELKSFSGRSTVLLKATTSQDLILKPFPAGNEKEDYSSLLLNNISNPLKEGKVVSMPNLGIFRPLRKEDGNFHVSFTPSTFLRKRLNENAASPKLDNALITKNDVVEESLATEKKDIDDIDKSLFDIGIGTGNMEKISEKSFAIENKPIDYFGEKRTKNFIIPSDETAEEKNRNKWKVIFALVIAIAIILTIVFLRKKEKDIPALAPKSESVNLMDLAEKNYGNPVFWVYIYESNQDKLNSPINIPQGAKLIIPDLSSPEYNININDSMEIFRAKLRSEDILQKLK
jgi:nucleoid DNA-binding protein